MPSGGPTASTEGERPGNLEREDRAERSPARKSPAIAIAAAVLFAASIWTAVIIILPSSTFALYWPRAKLPIVTAVVVMSVMAAALGYFRFSITGVRALLFVALAFGALATNQFVVGVLFPPSEIGRQTTVYAWTWGRMVTAVLLLLGALPRFRHVRRPRRPLAQLFAGSAAMLLALGGGLAFLWIFRRDLPPPSALTSSAIVSAPLRDLSSLDLSLGLLGSIAFLFAAVVYARPTSGSDPVARFLALALVIATFGHIHYTLLPMSLGRWVATGDLLLLTFTGIVLLGLLWDLRRTYHAERAHIDELSAAYLAEIQRTRELERVEQLQSGRIDLVAHELTHPVVALRGWIGTLLVRWHQIDDAEKIDVLRHLEAETVRLREVVERVPAVKDPQLELFPLTTRMVRVSDLVDEAAATFNAPRALEVRVDPDARKVVLCADGDRLLQVLRNLLSNAEKYAGRWTPVELSVERRDSEVVFCVSDRGPGIPRDDLTRIFDASYRGSARARRAGSGLGLFICRQIVEGHGGRIWATSERWRSATFCFSIPRWEGGP